MPQLLQLRVTRPRQKKMLDRPAGQQTTAAQQTMVQHQQDPFRAKQLFWEAASEGATGRAGSKLPPERSSHLLLFWKPNQEKAGRAGLKAQQLLPKIPSPLLHIHWKTGSWLESFQPPSRFSPPRVVRISPGDSQQSRQQIQQLRQAGVSDLPSLRRHQLTLPLLVRVKTIQRARALEDRSKWRTVLKDLR